MLAALPFPAPLYARIDMIRSPEGRLAVMEAELVEPYLYPDRGPEPGGANGGRNSTAAGE